MKQLQIKSLTSQIDIQTKSIKHLAAINLNMQKQHDVMEKTQTYIDRVKKSVPQASQPKPLPTTPIAERQTKPLPAAPIAARQSKPLPVTPIAAQHDKSLPIIPVKTQLPHQQHVKGLVDLPPNSSVMSKNFKTLLVKTESQLIGEEIKRRVTERIKKLEQQGIAQDPKLVKSRVMSEMVAEKKMREALAEKKESKAPDVPRRKL